MEVMLRANSVRRSPAGWRTSERDITDRETIALSPGVSTGGVGALPPTDIATRLCCCIADSHD
jgi:hypothetical protein